MNYLSQIQLASFENARPPEVEKSSFYYSFSLLPRDERKAITSIYSFLSYIDNIVDGTPTADPVALRRKGERLDWWENKIEQMYAGDLKAPALKPLAAVIKRFSLPKQYFLTLIDGCRRDLFQTRYETFEELKDYCYSVASVVGLMCIEIFGHKYEETKSYAVNLGYALQLTNILRDVKEDKDRGYIYLPREDLLRFDYTENDLFDEVYDDRFVELMQFEAQRARDYYHAARSKLKPDERANVFSAEIMDSIYYRLLEKIELNDYNVFKRRIRVSAVHKLMTTLKHWVSVKMFIMRLKKSL